MYIDCHTHCRDEEQKDKETIEHALRVAEDSGLSAIFDMPNVKKPIITLERVIERLKIAEKAGSSVFYGAYVGLTSNPEQISDAVDTYNDFFPNDQDSKVGVIGLKLFAGKSVGDLEVPGLKAQQTVYNTLKKLDYKGVVVVHCEKELLINEDLWNPKNPITHCVARPEISEISSVKDQINLINDSGYQGHFHIAHVSSPESIELIQEAKKKGFRISCGVTPHHLLLDNLLMNQEKGVLYKVNPPLRNPKSRESLFKSFAEGNIDILETDHAPHTEEDKLVRYMSGIPNLASWPDFIEILKLRGISQRFLDKVAFENVNKIFGTKIKKLNLPIKKDKHLGEYAFEPYKHLK